LKKKIEEKCWKVASVQYPVRKLKRISKNVATMMLEI
jgi:hypothetical protein